MTSAGKAGKLVVVGGRVEVVALDESAGAVVFPVAGSKGAARAVVARMTRVKRNEMEAIANGKKVHLLREKET